MDNFDLLDQRIKELGLTPQQIVERWIENEMLDPFDVVPKHIAYHDGAWPIKSGRNRKNQPIHVGEAKVYFDDENKQRLFVALRIIIAKTLCIDADMIQPASNFLMDLGADSLDMAELFQNIEQEFECSITDQKAEELRTVQSMIDYLSELGK